MQNKSSIAALRVVVIALEEVQAFKGTLPSYDDPAQEDDAPPDTFLSLVKQYAGQRVPESELIATVDAISPMFPTYQVRWK